MHPAPRPCPSRLPPRCPCHSAGALTKDLRGSNAACSHAGRGGRPGSLPKGGISGQRPVGLSSPAAAHDLGGRSRLLPKAPARRTFTGWQDAFHRQGLVPRVLVVHRFPAERRFREIGLHGGEVLAVGQRRMLHHEGDGHHLQPRGERSAARWLGTPRAGWKTLFCSPAPGPGPPVCSLAELNAAAGECSAAGSATHGADLGLTRPEVQHEAPSVLSCKDAGRGSRGSALHATRGDGEGASAALRVGK